tara:strand:- start:65832 stop:66794 length:963 start_codon:yes stop_codon:yes gene_type:complete
MRVLLTGASGFVGKYLYEALIAAGIEVRCGTRDVVAAQSRMPERDWVRLDVEAPETLENALRGCDGAFYLVHGMGQGADYPEKEARSARNFLSAAESSGVSRIVYLGGVLPAGQRVSKHLASRRETGKILRSGSISTIELRAAMIMGLGSTSWTMVRDLAARLPAMLLPRWLRNHSHPIAVDDVVWALLAALLSSEEASHVYDVPGPERVSHRDVLQRVAALQGHTRRMINIPILTPRLSSYWIALVTRVELDMAKELVEGVRYDLDPDEDILWDHFNHMPMTLEAGATLALEDETSQAVPSYASSRRGRAIGAEFAKTP